MQVTVNGKTQDIRESSTIQELLTSLGMGQGRIAVEVNGEIVSRSSFDQHNLEQDDKIEIVQAIGGG